jgi:hypothetical protein
VNPWRSARQHRRRPGFQLVDFEEVALPVYILSLRVITLAHKKVAPIEEFVLRSVDAGMSSQDEVAAFLGLQSNVVRGALVSLAQAESLALAGVPGSRAQTLLMTQKGRSVLEASELIVPEEQSFSIHFDGLLRRVELFKWTELLQPKEIRERGLLEIPSFPARKPMVSDLKLPEVEQLIRSSGAVGDQRRDLLAIRGIERATRLFREAVALVYAPDYGNEVQVSFATDTRLLEDHERAFAMAGGLKRMGINTASLFGGNERVWDGLDSGLLDAMANEDRLETLQDEITKADVMVQQSVRDLEGAESLQARIALSSRLEEARAILADKQRELERLRVRELCCYDCVPLFEEALACAKNRLVIVSPKVTAKVLNREVLKRFHELLTSGVMIFITVGPESQEKSVKDRAAIQNLIDMARANTRLFVKRDSRITQSVLGVDNLFVAMASFEWLGHTGDHYRGFSRRQGIIVRDPDKISRILDRYDLSEHVGDG